MREPFVLALDQGTTSTRAIVFDRDFCIVASAHETFPQHFPAPGWVEHDPEDLWRTAVSTIRSAVADAGLSARDLAAMGIANQRETAIVWDRETGKPVYNAIVWQDRRTAAACEQISASGGEELVRARTGLLIDPYFSATKIAWILDNVAGARERAENGGLAFGTVDSFLLWRLTGGAAHATDATNACRTLLYDIHKGRWSDDLIKLFRIPPAILPEVKDSAADFGSLSREILGEVVGIHGIAGDQQAATVGQACFKPGMVKATYGTGCFALLNTGSTPIVSTHRLLTTVAYQLAGKPCYAIEGSIFVAGAAVQWLRDSLGLIQSAEQVGPLAAQSDPEQPVYLVPAFVGLGAPHWDPNCRGALFGLSRSTGPKEFARAALESACFQTADLLEAMRADWDNPEMEHSVLRVDGGMAASDWFLQRLADVLGVQVDRPLTNEATALGAAYLAGLGANAYPSPDEFSRSWHLGASFKPEWSRELRNDRLVGWRDAVDRTLNERGRRSSWNVRNSRAGSSVSSA
jgi:glycerol kinase